MLIGYEIFQIGEIKVWNESVKLSADIYRTINESKNLKKDFGLRDQIQRSVVSIPSNIAEGFERETHAEFIRFLYFAKSSCAELKTQLLIAKEIEYLTEKIYTEFKKRCDHISIMIYKLINYLKKQ